MAEYNNAKNKRDPPLSFWSSKNDRIVTDWSGYDTPNPTNRFDAYQRQDDCSTTQHGNYNAVCYPGVSLQEPAENNCQVAPSEISQTLYHRAEPQSIDYSSLASRRNVDSHYQVAMDAKDQGERNAEIGYEETVIKVEYGSYADINLPFPDVGLPNWSSGPQHARPCPIPVTRLDSGLMGAVGGYEMDRSTRVRANLGPPVEHRPEPCMVDEFIRARPKAVRVGLGAPQSNQSPSQFSPEDCPKCKLDAKKKKKPSWLCKYHFHQAKLKSVGLRPQMATQDLGDCRLDTYEQDDPVERELSPCTYRSLPVVDLPVARWHNTTSRQWDPLPIEDDTIAGVPSLLSDRRNVNLPDCPDPDDAFGGSPRSMEDEEADWRNYFCGTEPRPPMLDSHPADAHNVSAISGHNPSDIPADNCPRCIEGVHNHDKTNWLCKAHYNQDMKQQQRLEKHLQNPINIKDQDQDDRANDNEGWHDGQGSSKEDWGPYTDWPMQNRRSTDVWSQDDLEASGGSGLRVVRATEPLPDFIPWQKQNPTDIPNQPAANEVRRPVKFEWLSKGVHPKKVCAVVDVDLSCMPPSEAIEPCPMCEEQSRRRGKPGWLCRQHYKKSCKDITEEEGKMKVTDQVQQKLDKVPAAPPLKLQTEKSTVEHSQDHRRQRSPAQETFSAHSRKRTHSGSRKEQCTAKSTGTDKKGENVPREAARDRECVLNKTPSKRARSLVDRERSPSKSRSSSGTGALKDLKERYPGWGREPRSSSRQHEKTSSQATKKEQVRNSKDPKWLAPPCLFKAGVMVYFPVRPALGPSRRSPDLRCYVRDVLTQTDNEKRTVAATVTPQEPIDLTLSDDELDRPAPQVVPLGQAFPPPLLEFQVERTLPLVKGGSLWPSTRHISSRIWKVIEDAGLIGKHGMKASDAQMIKDVIQQATSVLEKNNAPRDTSKRGNLKGVDAGKKRPEEVAAVVTVASHQKEKPLDSTVAQD